MQVEGHLDNYVMLFTARFRENLAQLHFGIILFLVV